VSEIRVELFTPSRLRDQAEGRALLDALGRYMPSWMPYRYGWSEPLRNVYDPAKSEHFWDTHYGLMFRNAKRSASGQVDVRTGAWDILSRIILSGRAPRAQLEGGIGPFLAQCGETLDLTYGMAHIFTEQQAADYYRLWFEIPSDDEDESVRSARVGPFPYCLRDLYWGNVFGPPYAELFGADRLRTAPAAIVTELRPGYFYLQVTDSILDLWDTATVPAYEAARDAVKQHLGPECFYDPAATTPRRAPAFRNSAEEGLWKPREGDRLGPGVKELLARIADQAKQAGQ
jgi:hypothetical protein